MVEAIIILIVKLFIVLGCNYRISEEIEECFSDNQHSGICDGCGFGFESNHSNYIKRKKLKKLVILNIL